MKGQHVTLRGLAGRVWGHFGIADPRKYTRYDYVLSALRQAKALGRREVMQQWKRRRKRAKRALQEALRAV